VIAEKKAATAVGIHPLLAKRWSGRAFDAREVTHEEIHAMLEAARWAPSSANEQPWRFVVVRRNDPSRAAVVASLTGANPRWADTAPVLIVAAAAANRERDGKPNRYAWHDTGLATAQLEMQATFFDLATHSMAGFDAEQLRTAVGIPAGVDPVTVIAVGHRGPAETLPEDLRVRELLPRTRRPLDDIAFAGRFGEPCMHEVSPAAGPPDGDEP
jgi:nitroreductase